MWGDKNTLLIIGDNGASPCGYSQHQKGHKPITNPQPQVAYLWINALPYRSCYTDARLVIIQNVYLPVKFRGAGVHPVKFFPEWC
jgi:hypothetical protein